MVNLSCETPFFATLASIEEHMAIFHAYAFADLYGLERANCVALIDSPVRDRALHGWHDHAGPLFLN